MTQSTPEMPSRAADVLISFDSGKPKIAHADTQDEAATVRGEIQAATYWLRRKGYDLRCRPYIEPDPRGGYRILYWAHPPYRGDSDAAPQ